VSGSLKVDLEVLDKEKKTWSSVKEKKDPIFTYDNWEPGYVDAKILKVDNEGTLALKWKAKFVSENELSELAKDDLSHARDELIHRLCNYRGFKKVNIILVFDAYRRRENEGSVTEIGGITVVYTKERQTADAYIEKSTYSLAEKNSVRVVTSDYEEQLVVLGVGGTRVSAREFIDEIKQAAAEIRGIIGG
jgi:predicted RNA-binding protein with PIN domain